MTGQAALLFPARPHLVGQARFSTAYAAAERAPFPLRRLDELLVSGGDHRLVVDHQTGHNKYGCSARPDETIHAFGSSTASSISRRGYDAAERLHRRLAGALAQGTDPDHLYARQLGRFRREILQLCGLAEGPGADIVFAASGSDLHLVAAQLLAGAGPTPLLSIMMEAAETGSGVPAALLGSHLSAVTPLGEEVLEGKMVEGGSLVELSAIASRAADGTPRPAMDIERDIENLVEAALAEGGRVLLTMVDVSKTGMVLPSPGFARELKRRFGERIEILVDACQFRLAPESLRAYLREGFLVAFTGSKFLTGPAFCGALLVPQAASRRLRRFGIAAGIGAYSPRADWPVGWNAAAHLPSAHNFGLLLRWEAALAELRAFRAVRHEDVRDFLTAFASAVAARIGADPAFAPLPVPAIDRGGLVAMQRAPLWDEVQTIFPFLLRSEGPDGLEYLDRTRTQSIYQALAAPAFPGAARRRYQLGQPVSCGSRSGVPVSALRLCASARLVVEAFALDGAGPRAVIERALAALDRTALLARHPPELPRRIA